MNIAFNSSRAHIDKVITCKRTTRAKVSEEKVEYLVNNLRDKFSLKNETDWNSLTAKDVRSLRGGSTLLSKHTLFEIKCKGFPKGKLNFTKPKKAIGYWDNEENVKNFMAQVKEKYNLKNAEDWKSITKENIQKQGGLSLLTNYSLEELKKIGCPDYLKKKEKIIKREKKPKDYWKYDSNRENFYSLLKEKYNYQTSDDWMNLSWKQIKDCGGSSLFSEFSLNEIKCMICPELKDKIKNKQKNKEIGFWDNLQNVNIFLNKIREEYNFKDANDWNLLTKKKIIDIGGNSLLNKYSIYKLKKLAHPEYDFKVIKKKPIGYWDKKENILDFFENLKKEYKLNTTEDWNRISKVQILKLGGSTLLSKFSLNTIIQMACPDVINLQKEQKRSNQRWLFIQIEKLYPKEEIIEDYFHEEMTRISGAPIQLDIFIINKNLAFEYQGIQHYTDMPERFSSLELYQYRDSEKKRICKEVGISLIIIPYWWDQTLEGLNELIANNYKKEEKIIKQ